MVIAVDLNAASCDSVRNITDIFGENVTNSNENRLREFTALKNYVLRIDSSEKTMQICTLGVPENLVDRLYCSKQKAFITSQRRLCFS